MSTTDCRPLNIYRIPIYQRRLAGLDNYASVPHARSPSPNMSIPVSRRRHSTPPASAVLLAAMKSPPPSRMIKHLYPKTRLVRIAREQMPSSDPVKSPARPATLVKPRYQDERTGRIATTPTNPNSKTPSPIRPDTPLMNRRISIKKRERAFSLDLEDDDHVLNMGALREDSSKSLSTNWCHRKCLCRFSHYNLCYWYFKCPFFCWIACLLSLLGVFIGVLVVMGLMSRTKPSVDGSRPPQGNLTLNDCPTNTTCAVQLQSI